jgi:hypothetical protein
MTHELLLSLLTMGMHAIVDGVMRLAKGGTIDDALATTIERLQDERAKAKFAAFRP